MKVELMTIRVCCGQEMSAPFGGNGSGEITAGHTIYIVTNDESDKI